jgi:hypothetical protein
MLRTSSYGTHRAHEQAYIVSETTRSATENERICTHSRQEIRVYIIDKWGDKWGRRSRSGKDATHPISSLTKSLTMILLPESLPGVTTPLRVRMFCHPSRWVSLTAKLDSSCESHAGRRLSRWWMSHSCWSASSVARGCVRVCGCVRQVSVCVYEQSSTCARVHEHTLTISSRTTHTHTMGECVIDLVALTSGLEHRLVLIRLRVPRRGYHVLPLQNEERGFSTRKPREKCLQRPAKSVGCDRNSPKVKGSTVLTS